MAEPRCVIVPALLKYFQRGGNRALRAIKVIGVAGLVLGPAAALTVILLSGLVAPSAGADVSGLAASPAPVPGDRFPFQAPSSGHVTATDPQALNVRVVTFEAKGVAEGFGQFTLNGQEVLDASMVPPECTSGVGSTGLHGSGTVIFPDGMVRVQSASSRVCIDATDTANATAVFHYRIVGGSNRFDNAEGQITLELVGSRSIFGFTFTGDFSGEIVVPP